MWQIYSFLCFALLAYRVDGANDTTQSVVPLATTAAATPKALRIFVDSLTNDYLAIEKTLWTKIEMQQLLVERGQLLDEIYREHKRILEADFGQHATIWSLGLQRHAKLINEILAINTNAQNIKEYIFAKENDKVLELAQNAHEQMETSATEFYQLISDKSFWDNIAYNVSKTGGGGGCGGVDERTPALNSFISGGQRATMRQEAGRGLAQRPSADL